MSGVTKLGVDDEEFLVASIIERCPKLMMLRELYQNALDAAALAEGEKVVRIGAVSVDGVPKLRIWNTGPGMDPVSLHAMCDLSSSIGKLKGLDRNFGIGAKVASLPSNHLGVRYRSCTEGGVYQITIGKRDGIYGRIRTDNRAPEIQDVTSEAIGAGETLDHDWTEVVLLGMRPDQNTCANPYDDEPKVDRYWVPDTLFLRYLRTPEGVKTLIDPGLQSFDVLREFYPMAGRLEAYERHEAVAADRGIKVHFFHDPAHPVRHWENRSNDGALQPTTALLAVAHKDELYDVQRGSSWFYEAPRYGVTFGSRHLSVIIELPEDFDVIPDMYRQFLKYRSNTQGNVRASDFARIVMESRPQWVRDLLRQEYEHDFDREVAPLSAELSELMHRAKFVPPAVAVANHEAADGSSFSSAIRSLCGIQPVLLQDPVDVRDRWLEGRAAVYYPDTGQICINMLYNSAASFRDQISSACKTSGEMFDEAAISRVASFHYVRRLLRALILALGKGSNSVNWKAEHIQRSVSPEALSTAANDMDDLLDVALSALRASASEAGSSPQRGAAL